MHTLTLELPDEIYQPLLHQARRSASTPEALLTQWAAQAVRTQQDTLLKLLGSVETDVSDVSGKHDDLLGHALQTDAGR